MTMRSLGCVLAVDMGGRETYGRLFDGLNPRGRGGEDGKEALSGQMVEGRRVI